MMKRKPAAGEAEADGSAPKKKRRSQPMGNLTNAQKRRLCVKFAQVKMTQQELCQWAKKEFQLQNLPHQSTISKILARAGELTSMAPRDLSARRKGFVTHPELDTALCNWVLCARANGLKISGDIIKAQARALAAQLGVAGSMTFSNGWLGGFKKRHNIRLGSAAASAAVADGGDGAALSTLSPATSLAHLQQIARMYEPRDVFCMGETGLLFEVSPEKPAGRGRAAAAARKDQRGERLTLALGVNADASERLEPMFIGPAKLPDGAPLREELDADAGNFYYQNNKKAWMTPVLFQDWVSALDTKMRDEGRVVLLLVSPAPSHITLGLELTNVRLEMLPTTRTSSGADSSGLTPPSGLLPGVDPVQALAAAQTPAQQPPTSMLQPLDNGLVTAFKRRYRRYHMFHALDRYEAGLQDVFHVGQLQAMRWTRYCWKALPEDVIRQCWAATGIVAPAPSPEAAAAREAAEEEIDKEICDTVSALDILRPLLIDEFVSPRDENEGIHCAGTDDSDFVFTVPDYSVGEDTAKPSGGRKAAQQQQVPEQQQQQQVPEQQQQQQQPAGPTALTPRLQELHARNGAAIAAAATAIATSVLIGEDAAAVGPTQEEALGLSMVAASTAGGEAGAKASDAPASNEQLIECFRVLLPELDRLRFDDHTKKSIRSTFRRLKETAEQQALDRKRGTVRKTPPPPHFPPHMQPPQQLALHHEQQQQLARQQQQALAMAAQATHVTEDTVI